VRAAKLADGFDPSGVPARLAFVIEIAPGVSPQAARSWFAGKIRA
jgi:hypothetical protein